MKAYFVWTVVGPQIILTSCDLQKNPGCLLQTGRAVIDSWANKVMAFEISLDIVKQRFGEQVAVVSNDPNQTDELRIVAADGEHVLNNIHFTELGQPIYYEPDNAKPVNTQYATKK